MLTWNVYVGNFNKGEIEVYNIFEHISFVEDCRKAAKKYAKDRELFEKEVRTSLNYYFWSKCEWEIIIEHWPPSDRCRDEKIDVADQVKLNWGIFMDYLWAHRKEL